MITQSMQALYHGCQGKPMNENMVIAMKTVEAISFIALIVIGALALHKVIPLSSHAVLPMIAVGTAGLTGIFVLSAWKNWLSVPEFIGKKISCSGQ